MAQSPESIIMFQLRPQYDSDSVSSPKTLPRARHSNSPIDILRITFISLVREVRVSASNAPLTSCPRWALSLLDFIHNPPRNRRAGEMKSKIQISFSSTLRFLSPFGGCDWRTTIKKHTQRTETTTTTATENAPILPLLTQKRRPHSGPGIKHTVCALAKTNRRSRSLPLPVCTCFFSQCFICAVCLSTPAPLSFSLTV